MAPAKSGSKSASKSAGATTSASGSRGTRAAPAGLGSSDGQSIDDAQAQNTGKTSRLSKVSQASASKTASKRAKGRSAGPDPIDDKDLRKSLEIPGARSGADEDTAFARNRDVAPPTQQEMSAAAQAEIQGKADRVFRQRGRVNDFADSPSEKFAPKTAFPHPFTGTQVDRVGGVAEIAHKAGVYGMDSRDYHSRLVALGQAIGVGDDGSMDPRDRLTRLVALHDLLINAARYGNSVAEDDDIVAQAGLNTGGKKGGAYKTDNAVEVLAQVGLLPGDL